MSLDGLILNQASTEISATSVLEADVQRGGASISAMANERVTNPVLRAYSKLSPGRQRIYRHFVPQASPACSRMLAVRAPRPVRSLSQVEGQLVCFEVVLSVLYLWYNICAGSSATTASQYSSQCPTPTGLDTLPIHGTIIRRTSSTSASGGTTAAAQVIVQMMERPYSSGRRSEDIQPRGASIFIPIGWSPAFAASNASFTRVTESLCVDPADSFCQQKAYVSSRGPRSTSRDPL
ncbi:uncharacterized protein ARMOST_16099 [Armillaria ostoyae]|uniref:Uncharacterized protein n=1 Tax=Armillaria ostoyae TaxID=47428 RepID=A0A284RV79_ARMOS|nr:uncharacterized protein ARMOST_16099 [Armillaria ostoyae]